MKKVILFAFIALSLVSCNSSNSKSERRNHKDSSVSSEESGRINRKDPKFEESDWEYVKDRFTVDEFIDVAKEKVHENILAKKYSKAYQRGEYNDRFKKVTIPEYVDNALIYGNDEKWSDALEKLYAFAKEQKLKSSTLEQFPSKADKLGIMEGILATEMVRYIRDEYPAPFKFNSPKIFNMEAEGTMEWTFDRINIDGTKKTYQLFKQNGDWHWRQ